MWSTLADLGQIQTEMYLIKQQTINQMSSLT